MSQNIAPPKNIIHRHIHFNHFLVEEGSSKLLFLWVDPTSWLLAIHDLPLHVNTGGLYGIGVMLIDPLSPLHIILMLDYYGIFPSRITIDVDPLYMINI